MSVGRGRRGLIALLVLGILLPGVILAVFGFRSLTSPLTKIASTSAVQSAAPARDAEPITDE